MNVLLTGASTGLGLAISRALIRTPHRLVLTAREGSMQRFAETGIVENERVLLRALDVTHDEQRSEVVDEIEWRWGGVDALINNAGFSIRAVVEHVRDEDRIAQEDINYRSPMELIRLVLPGMRRKRAGRILSISSVGGMMAMPTMSVYSASKFALEGAHEALWYEMRPWGIHVSLIEPGFIRSNSFEHTFDTPAGVSSTDFDSDPYHAHYAYMKPFVARLMNTTWATPERVARVILRTLSRRHPALRVPATPDAWLFSLLRRFLPYRLYHEILYRCLPGIRHWGPNQPGSK